MLRFHAPFGALVYFSLFVPYIVNIQNAFNERFKKKAEKVIFFEMHDA